MNNETGAIEIAARCLVDFPEAPWDLRMSLARQVADEARHARLLLRRLQELDGCKGEFPVANFEWGVTLMLDNLPGRLAVQNRTFEAGLIDILGTLRNRWREAGDHQTADLLEGILADEVTHVRFANRWIKRLTEEDPRNLLQGGPWRSATWARSTGALAARRSARPTQPGTTWTEERRSAPAVNVEDRRAAEFTEEEVDEVLRQAGFRSILPSLARAGSTMPPSDTAPSRSTPQLFGDGPARDARFTVREVWAEWRTTRRDAGNGIRVPAPADERRDERHGECRPQPGGLSRRRMGRAHVAGPPVRRRGPAHHELPAAARWRGAAAWASTRSPTSSTAILGRIDNLIGRLAVQNRSFEADGLDAATHALR